jgi:hypothetical protein
MMCSLGQQQEELHILYPSPNIIRHFKSKRMRWVGHVVHMREERKVYKVLVGKARRKETTWKKRRRWEENGS